MGSVIMGIGLYLTKREGDVITPSMVGGRG